MTERISSNQYTLLRALPLSFERVVEFNQVMFYSLIRRGFVKLNNTTEQFVRSDAGDTAVKAYSNGNPKDLTVKNNPESRQNRVSDKLHQKKPKKPAKSAPKHEQAAVA